MALTLGLACVPGALLADDSSVDKADDAYRWQLTADAVRLADTSNATFHSNREMVNLSRSYSHDANSGRILLDHRNSGVLKLLRLRSLSLLTLASTNNSKLFIGVSDDGVPGLHFTQMTKRQRSRHVELSRLPFLTADSEE